MTRSFSPHKLSPVTDDQQEKAIPFFSIDWEKLLFPKLQLHYCKMDDDVIVDIDVEDINEEPTVFNEGHQVSTTAPEQPMVSSATLKQKSSSPTLLSKQYFQDDDMDEQSRQLIEQMLAEEEYFYGRDTLSTLKGNKTSSSSSSKKRKLSKTSSTASSSSAKGGNTHESSASLPSHKTKWTEEEDERLREALEKFGHGNWKPVSEYVGTRNPLQCKNHARHLQQYNKLEVQSKRRKIDQPSDVMKEEEIDGSQSPEEKQNAKEGAVKPHVTPAALDSESDFEIDDDEDVDIVQADQDDIPSKIEKQHKEPTLQTSISIESDQNIVEKTTLSTEPVSSSSSNTTTAVSTEPDSARSSEHSTNSSQVNISPKIDNPTIDKEQDTESYTSKNTHSMPRLAPREATPSPNNDALAQPHTPVFSPYEIAEEEKMHNPEWFRGKATKTPDRYLKIRNHMLACWEQCKPRYLTKTSARKGLKDCGDVNAIGRVHEYLESIGVINVDTVSGGPRIMKQRTLAPREYVVDENDGFDEAADLVVQYDGPRKRKVRNELGEWVDPKELEGRVIEHQVIIRTDSKPKRLVRRSHHHQFYGGDEFGRGYDPFRLVPTESYNEDLPAPFEVEIISDALLVMDFHSHLAHTEIIGLLGGNFIQKGDIHVLQVKTVFPCRSTSTGIQCEMDPASEMRAREVFAEKGLNVVGWYHSHPTFEPHPSIRDIENQTSYQTLFRDEKTGDEPFIGVIVTPYDPEILSNHSQIQYLHISKEIDKLHSHRVPYACRRTVIQSEHVPQDILDQFQELIQEYKDYEHKVNMLSMFGDQTRLDKLLDSMRAHLYLEPNDEQIVIDKVKVMIEKDFLTAAAATVAETTETTTTPKNNDDDTTIKTEETVTTTTNNATDV